MNDSTRKNGLTIVNLALMILVFAWNAAAITNVFKPKVYLPDHVTDHTTNSLGAKFWYQIIYDEEKPPAVSNYDAFSSFIKHEIHDAANNIYYMQFGMVPEDSTDEHGDSLLSSNPDNCAFDSNLFDASALDIDYCMSDEIDIDFNNDSGIVGARFKRADNKNLLGLG